MDNWDDLAFWNRTETDTKGHGSELGLVTFASLKIMKAHVIRSPIQSFDQDVHSRTIVNLSEYLLRVRRRHRYRDRPKCWTSLSEVRSLRRHDTSRPLRVHDRDRVRASKTHSLIMSMSRAKSTWLFFAITSGACAAFNGVFAKLCVPTPSPRPVLIMAQYNNRAHRFLVELSRHGVWTRPFKQIL